MKTSTKAKATASKVAKLEGRKVTRDFVAKLNAFVESRSFYNLYKKQVAEGRAEIFAEIGEEAQTLIHNGVKVAVISKVSKPQLDLDKLKEKYPKAYADCLTSRDEFHIRLATPKK